MSNDNEESDTSRKEVDGHTASVANGGEEDRKEEQVSPQQGQPPVGLGRGLASLDLKKRKAQTKATG